MLFLELLFVISHVIFRCGGLLVGQLDKVSFYEKKQDQFKVHILPLEGIIFLLII